MQGVCVLVFGGLGAERFVSVASAINLANSYDFAKALFIDADGKCHHVALSSLCNAEVNFAGYPAFDKSLVAPDFSSYLATVPAGEIFFLALHGTFGEDGGIQAILEEKGFAFTGSSARASALAFNKIETKKIAASYGVQMARSIDFKDILTRPSDFNFPVIAKPVADGSSHGLHRFDSGQALAIFADEQQFDFADYLIEEMIVGREFSCGVFEHNGQLKGLEPVEIIHSSKVFDYAAKYLDSAVREVCPADLADVFKAELKTATALVHRAVGCRGYSRADFILRDNSFYFLEINTLPGLSKNSIYPKALRAEGYSLQQFIAEQIAIAHRGLVPQAGLDIQKRPSA